MVGEYRRWEERVGKGERRGSESRVRKGRVG